MQAGQWTAGLSAIFVANSTLSGASNTCRRSLQRSRRAIFNRGAFMRFLTPDVAFLLSHAAFSTFGMCCCCTATDRANPTLKSRTRRVQYNKGDATWLRDHQHGVIYQDLPDLAGAASVGKVRKRHLRSF